MMEYKPPTTIVICYSILYFLLSSKRYLYHSIFSIFFLPKRHCFSYSTHIQNLCIIHFQPQNFFLQHTGGKSTPLLAFVYSLFRASDYLICLCTFYIKNLHFLSFLLHFLSRNTINKTGDNKLPYLTSILTSNYSSVS